VSNPPQVSFLFQSRSGNETEPARPTDGRPAEDKNRPAFLSFSNGVGRRSGRFSLAAAVRVSAFLRSRGVGYQLRGLIVALCATLPLSVYSTGCSDPLPNPPRAILEASVGKPAGTNCKLGGITFQRIGSFNTTSDRPVTDPIQDGALYENAVVNVSCRVIPRGATFDFAAETTRQGQGTIRMTAATLASSGSSKVQVVLAGGELGDRYTQDDCEFTPFHPNGEYDATVNGQMTKLPDVAAGRIWGRIKCGKIVRTDQDPEITCSTDIDFRFENCTQADPQN
jgi:hypothetical protein